RNIHIQSDPHRIDEPVVFGSSSDTVHVYAMPYLQPNIFAGEKDSGTDDCVHAVSRIMKRMDDSVCSILMGHLFTAGAQLSESERAPVGALEETDAALFAPFDYTALGHLHRPQNVTDSVVYSGSLLKYSFSEHRDEKSVVLLEYDGASLNRTCFPLRPPRDMTVLNGSIEELMHDPSFEPFTDHFIEAQLTDRTIIPRPSELISRRFPWLLSVRQKAENVQQREDSVSFDPAATRVETYEAFCAYVSGDKPSDEKREMFERIAREDEHEA
ncbi:MAG: metallophosphoesterase family protein, partial [Spirochaetota bacterium]